MSADACPGCGRHHAQPVEEVAVGPGALERLGSFVASKRWRTLLVVDDANTGEALGARLALDLGAAGHRVAGHRFPERHGLLADRAALAAVRAGLAGERPDAAVAVGSGVLNDLTRYAAYLEGLPYVAVPTAASMDGYASNVAAMQFDGVKVSFPARPPAGVFADLEVVAGAPAEMTVWGLGDLLGKACARFDWVLASGLLGEAFCPVVEARVLGPLEFCAANAGRARRGDPEALAQLVRGLVESGTAMAMMGSSRPASGCEHHASHFWDLLAYRSLRPHGPHGLQVGYATRFATAIQQAVLGYLPAAGAPPAGCGLDDGDGEAEAEAHRWYGEQLAALDGVARDKAAELAASAATWPGEPAAREALLGRLTAVADGFAAVDRALADSGVPDQPGFLGVDREMLGATFRLARRLRSRYTSLDFLAGAGALEAVVESVVGG